MDTLWQDLRYAVRMLVKNPGFTLVAALSLALGIGANTTIFTVINALFLQPLPVEEPSRLVAIFTTDANITSRQFGFAPTSYPNFRDYRDRNQSFSGLVAVGFPPMSLSSGTGDPVQVNAHIVSGNYFDVLGVKPAAGRTFLPEEDSTPGTHPVVVLSNRLWKERFGGDPNLMGKTITLNRLGFTVVGVTPPNFRGTFAVFGPDLYVPMAMHDQVFQGIARQWFNERRALLFFVYGRLKPGITLAQAQAEMKTIGKQLEEAYPRENDKRSVALLPLAKAALNPNQQSDLELAGAMLMGAVALVLLIACANVANLMLARAAGREREIAVRLSLGASRGRLVQQLLTESLVLAAVAGALGFLVAVWGRNLLWNLRPPFLRANALDLNLDARVLAFTVIVSLLTGVLFGLVPALQASKATVAAALRDRAGQRSDANRRFSVRNVLVMGQVALSLIALVGAGLFLRSLQNAQKIDPGFETRNLLVMGFDIGAQGYDTARGKEFYRQLVERLQALPMVKTASVSFNAPFGGGFSRTVFPEGVDNSDRRNGVLTQLNQVDTHYFEATGIPVLRGRGFTEADREGVPMVAIINQTMEKRFWPKQDALGKRFRVFGETWLIEVIGIAKDSKYTTLGEEPEPFFYLPMLQHYTPQVTLHVRTNGDPKGLVNTIRGQVQAMEPTMPLVQVNTMREVIDQVLWAPRMGAGLLGVFGGLALLLAALGVYGVTSYSVTQRTQEIGIRMALGAQQSDVLRLILGQGVTIIGIGLAVGLAAALAITRALGSLLFGVGTSDPVTFVSTAVLLAAAALVAGYIPARRALKVDPILALRYE